MGKRRTERERERCGDAWAIPLVFDSGRRFSTIAEEIIEREGDILDLVNPPLA